LLSKVDIEFLSSLAGTGEYGLPIGGGGIFDNDRNGRFLVLCRNPFNDAGNRAHCEQNDKVTPL
jgi:hypothetical protein